MGNLLPCSRGGHPGSKRGSESTSHILDRESHPSQKDGKKLKYPCYLELGPMRVPVSMPKILIVAANKDSNQVSAISAAVSKLEIVVTVADSVDSALYEFNKHYHDLVLMELSSTNKFSPETILSSIVETEESMDTAILGILPANKLHSDESGVLPWLGKGVTQVLGESSSEIYWSNQLVQMLLGPVWSKACIRATRTLFSALDNVKDIVQITDKERKVLWINRAAESELGWSKEEMLGKDIGEIQTTGSCETSQNVRDSDPWFLNRMQEGKVWEGPINCRRKTGDYTTLPSTVLPVSLKKQRQPDQLVFIKTRSINSPAVTRISRNSPSISRPSRHCSIKKPTDSTMAQYYESHPVYSPRRRSSGKIHNMSLEAPITKVINIILAAQENQPVYIAQALDKVVEILKSSSSSDLFNPEVDKGTSRRHDLVTKDLLGALLESGKNEPLKNQHRRSSGEKSVSFSPRPSAPTLEVTPVQIGELLSTSHLYSFDIIRLEELTEKRPLLWLGMNLLMKFQVNKTLNVEDTVIQNWLNLIESSYRSTVSYHNSTHAADVLQSAAYFLERPAVQDMFDAVDELVILIGAIIHDVGHPGRNSAFLCNSRDELAMLYNDTTVLENHHCALGYKLTTSSDSVNIFKNLDSEMYKLVRKGLIDTVLATDMSKHFVHVNKFTTVFGCGSDEEGPPALNGVTDAEQRCIVKRMLIKCADVSNCARPLELCKEWAVRIAEEYFSQTEEEKKLGLPVVMPQFDRSTCSIPQSQIGFYDFFIYGMFDAWHAFADCKELTDNINNNTEYWKKKLQEEADTGVRLIFSRRADRATRQNKSGRSSRDTSEGIEEEQEDLSESFEEGSNDRNNGENKSRQSSLSERRPSEPDKEADPSAGDGPSESVNPVPNRIEVKS